MAMWSDRVRLTKPYSFGDIKVPEGAVLRVETPTFFYAVHDGWRVWLPDGAFTIVVTLDQAEPVE